MLETPHTEILSPAPTCLVPDQGLEWGEDRMICLEIAGPVLEADMGEQGSCDYNYVLWHHIWFLFNNTILLSLANILVGLLD